MVKSFISEYFVIEELMKLVRHIVFALLFFAFFMQFTTLVVSPVSEIPMAISFLFILPDNNLCESWSKKSTVSIPASKNLVKESNATAREAPLAKKIIL